jgi:hypothetical protein
MGSASNEAAFIEAKDLRKTYHVGKIEVEVDALLLAGWFDEG